MNLLAGSGSGAVNPINAAAAASSAQPETLESVVAAAKVAPVPTTEPTPTPRPEASAPTPPTPEPPKDEQPDGESRWKALASLPALLLLAVILMGGGLYAHFSDVAKKQADDNRATYQQVAEQRAADQQKSNISTLVVKNLTGTTATFQDIQVTGTATINNLLARLGQIDQLNATSTTTETLVVRGATFSGSTATSGNTTTGSLNVSGGTTLAGLASNGQVWLTGDSNDVLIIQAQKDNQNLVSLRNASGSEVTSLDSSGNLSLGGNATVGGTLTVPTAHVGDLTANTATIGSLITTGQGVFTATPTGSGVNQGTVYINPATANPGDTLLGLAVNGSQKLRVDASGNFSNAGALNVAGATTLGSSLNVAGSTVLSGSLQAGSSTLSSLAVTGNATVGGTLGATGATTLGGTLNVNGATTLGGTLSVANNTTIGGDLYLAPGKSLYFAGSTTFPGSPTEGQVFYRTDTKQLYVYENNKWQADRSSVTLIVAASNTQSKEKADYVGDGTNDQNAINAAIAALPAGGGSVVLLDGTYNLTGSVNISKSNVVLTGSGASTNLKRMWQTVGTATNLITIGDNTNPYKNIQVSGMRFDGNGGAFTDVNNQAVIIQANVSYSAVQQLIIANTTAYNGGISSFGTVSLPNSHLTIQENYFESGMRRIYLGYSTDVNVDGNRNAFHIFGENSSHIKITRNEIYPDSGFTGILAWTGCSDYTISENTIYGTSWGPGIYNTCDNVTISNNYITATSWDGIYVAGTNQNVTGNMLVGRGIVATGTGHTISNNTISSSNGYGIDITTGTNNATVQGNNIIAPTTFGIQIEGNAANNLISNNKISEFGGTAGINDISTGSNNRIVNNDITKTTGSTKAIVISSAVPDLYLSGNTFTGVGAAGIQDSGKNVVYANQANTAGSIITNGQAGVGINTTSPTASLQNTGALVNSAVATPAAPTVAAQGATGATTWAYRVTAYDGLGETLASTATTIANGNATLSATNYNLITPTRVSGAVSYKIYRTTAGGTPATTGLIGTLAGGATTFAFSDTGLAASGAVPTVNTTGSATIANYLGINNATPANRLAVNGVTSSNGSTQAAQALIGTGGTANLGLVIQGVASQTGDLIQLQDSAGNITGSLSAAGGSSSSALLLANVSANHRLRVVADTNRGYMQTDDSLYFTGVFTATPRVGIEVNASTGNSLFVRAATTQTADLFQVQDSAAAVLGAFSSSGQLKVASAAAYNGALNVGTNTTTAAGGIYLGTDTNLYRSAAGALKTDGTFNAQDAIYIQGPGGSATGTPPFGTIAMGATALTIKAYDNSTNNYIALRGTTSYGTGTIIQGERSNVIQTGSYTEVANTNYSALVVKPGALTFTAPSTADYNALLVDAQASTFLGSGTARLLNLKYSGTTRFGVGIQGDTNIDLGSPSVVGLTIKAASSQTANLTQWKNSSGTVLASVDSGGVGAFNGLTVSGVTTGLNNIRSATNVLSTYTGDNAFNVRNVGTTPDAVATTFLEGYGAASKALVVRGAAGQTADILQVQNSSSNVLTSIDALGKLKVVVSDSSAGAYGLYVSNTPASGTPNGIYARTGQNGTNFIYAAGVASDTPFWGIQGNKKMVFGDGTGTFDTNLYRSGVGALITDGTFTSGGNITIGGAGSRLNRDVDNSELSLLSATGKGTGAYIRIVGDTSATSPGAIDVTTKGTGAFSIRNAAIGSTTNPVILSVDSTGTLLFGSAGDTNLYRSSANLLKTDDGFDAVGSIRGSSFVYAGLGTASQIVMGDVGGQGLARIGFGSAGDTNLYRSTTSTLKTDGALIVGGTNATNSAGAFQVQNTGGASVLNVDTTNSTVTVRGNNSDAVLGSELITITDFTDPSWTSTGWSTTSTTAAHTTGNTNNLSTNQFTPVAGATYQITFTVSGGPSAAETVRPQIGGVAGAAFGGNSAPQTQVITATGSGAFNFAPTSNWNGTISAVSVKRVTLSSVALAVQASNGVNSLEVRTGMGVGGNNSTLVGVGAGQANITGYSLVALGWNALQSNTSAAFNTAIGIQALQRTTTGGANTAVGGQAMAANTTGYQNTAVGSSALSANTTGTDNVAIGRTSAAQNTNGSLNVAVGSSALFSNTTGGQNIAVGGSSLFANINGANNAGVGSNALQGNTSGSNNSALGNSAGYTSTPANANTTGGNNTYIGAFSGPGSATQYNNSSAIGYRSVVTQSDTLILGCISGVNSCPTTTKVGIGNSAPTNTLGVTGTIGASGSITASTTPDISETISADDDVEPADVVSADPGKTEYARKSQGAYDPAVLGVISDGTSSFKINSHAGAEGADPTGKYLVLAGRVPVKVTNEGGAIQPGDYLTASSTPGKAMKATHAGPTIGKALASFSGADGSVMIQTNLSYYDPSSGSQVQGQGSDFTDLNASGTATVANLVVTGTANFVDIVVNGHIITGGGQPTALTLASGGTATIEGTDTTGTLTITTGATPVAGGLVKVSFSKSYTAAPRVVLSASSDTAADLRIYKDSATTGYVLIDSKDAPAPNTTYKFDYFIAQ